MDDRPLSCQERDKNDIFYCSNFIKSNNAACLRHLRYFRCLLRFHFTLVLSENFICLLPLCFCNFLFIGAMFLPKSIFVECFIFCETVD